MEPSCGYVICEMSSRWGMLSLVFREGVWATSIESGSQSWYQIGQPYLTTHNPHAGNPNHPGVLGP